MAELKYLPDGYLKQNMKVLDTGIQSNPRWEFECAHCNRTIKRDESHLMTSMVTMDNTRMAAYIHVCMDCVALLDLPLVEEEQ